MDISNEFAKDIAISLDSVAKILARQSGQLVEVDEWMYHLDHKLGDVLRLAHVAAKARPKTSKFALAVAIGAGVYIGYKYAEIKFADEKSNWAEAVKDKEPAQAKPKDSIHTDNIG